jgi:hypothetical protein
VEGDVVEEDDVAGTQGEGEALDDVSLETSAVDRALNEARGGGAVRWHIEHLHRELKQLTGTEKCECRKARSRRNHLGCCYLAWLALRLRATQLQRSLYAVQHALFSDFLRGELRHPHIPAFAGS